MKKLNIEMEVKLCKKLDSLNGIAYLDDKQVVDLRVRKQYAEVPSVSVWIREV